jgi:hypothetical protein
MFCRRSLGVPIELAILEHVSDPFDLPGEECRRIGTRKSASNAIGCGLVADRLGGVNHNPMSIYTHASEAASPK